MGKKKIEGASPTGKEGVSRAECRRRVTLTFRIRPTTIRSVFDAVRSLVTEEVKEILTRCSVFHFLDFPAFNQNVPLMQRMLNLWNVEEEAFMINGRAIKFTAEDVALIIGMPNRGKKVNAGNLSPLHPQDSMVFRDAMKAISSASTAEEFAKLFIQFLISNIFFISSNFRISSAYLNYANNLEEFLLFNWPEAIHYYMIRQFASYTSRRLENKRPGYIGGFITILLIWFLEHINVYEANFPDRRPRMMRWSIKIHWSEEELSSLFLSLQDSQISDVLQGVDDVERLLIGNEFLALPAPSSPQMSHFHTPPPPQLTHYPTPDVPQSSPEPSFDFPGKVFMEEILSRMGKLEEEVRMLKDIVMEMKKAKGPADKDFPEKADHDLSPSAPNFAEGSEGLKMLSEYLEKESPMKITKDVEAPILDSEASTNVIAGVVKVLQQEYPAEEEPLDQESPRNLIEDFEAAVTEDVPEDFEAVTGAGIVMGLRHPREKFPMAEEALYQDGPNKRARIENKALTEESPTTASKFIMQTSIAFRVKFRDDRTKKLVESPFTDEGKNKKIKAPIKRGRKKGKVPTSKHKSIPVEEYPDKVVAAEKKMNFIGRDEIEEECLAYLDSCFERFQDKSDVVFRSGENIELFRGTLDELITNQTLSDNLIDAFVCLLSDKAQLDREAHQPFLYLSSLCHLYNGHNHDCESFVKHINKELLAQSKYLFITISLGNHWVLIAGDLKEQKWDLYDSLPNPTHFAAVAPVLESTHKFLSKEFDSDFRKWPVTRVEGTPRQLNSIDCGMYVCKYIEALVTAKEPLKWSDYQDVWANNMHIYRAQLAFDLYSRHPSVL